MGKVVLARVDARLIHGLRYLSQMIHRHTIRLQRISFSGQAHAPA